MARLTAILLLACAACLLSWTAAAGATKAPAKGMAIDDVIVTDLAPTTAISQRIKVSEIKFYTGVVQGSGKPCLVAKGTVTALDNIKGVSKVKVVISICCLNVGPRVLSEIVATAEFVTGSTVANFIGVGKSIRPAHGSYSVAILPADRPTGDWKEAEPPRESGLKE